MVKKYSKLSRRTKNSKTNRRTKITKRTKLSKRSKKSNINSKTKKYCKSKLKNKIRKNIDEMKFGNKRIKSIAQAIAISYSQINKKYPKCSKSLKRK
jgi:hypothetical protein